MGEFPSGQRGQTVNLLLFSFDGPNPSSPTRNAPKNSGLFLFQTIHHTDLANPLQGLFYARKKRDIARKRIFYVKNFISNVGEGAMKVEVNDFDIRHYSALVNNSPMYNRMKKFTVLCGAVFIFIALLTILVALKDRTVDPVMIICLTTVFFVFGVYVYRTRKANPAVSFRTFTEKNPDYKLKVSFEEEEIVLNSSTSFSNTNSTYKYVRLARAAAKDGFFIILVEGTGYIVFDKNEIVEGTAEELRALLRSKLGTKFKEK